MSGMFGWSYPPGCDGVPDDDIPDKELEPVCEHKEEDRCSECQKCFDCCKCVIDDDGYLQLSPDSLLAKARLECEQEAAAEAIERQKIIDFFLSGGGGHEDGIDGARATTYSFGGMVDMVQAYVEHLREKGGKA